MDFNALSRVESMGDEIRKTTTPKIMIDHHLEPEGFEDYGMWNPYACATAELIYDFIEMNDDVDLIDRNIASCLYTGLITDSGSFKFSNVTAKVHRITARLMEAGIDHTDIHQKVFDSMTENRLRFFGLCMKDKLVVLPEFRAAYISITKEEIRKYNIQTGDTEGLVNFPMGLDSVILSAVIVDRDKEVKLSIRSKGSFPANEMAKKYFKGGG
ncbi:MAG: bifunctional oligoribonuclease/PAP phosphatase NrnA, partial [Bacteroidetes bacterium]|nr:bifunctional oligoribonuclease/PAP phosphatase NrnA [Bacteroidota bacterium]